MADLPDQTPEEDEIFQLFRILRESTARVSDAFVRRVSTRLSSLVDEDRLRHPSLISMVERLSVDSWNIVADAATPDGKATGDDTENGDEDESNDDSDD